MKMTMKTDPTGIARFNKLLEDFTKATGKTAEEGLQRMAKSAVRRLVTTVQPYGLKGDKLNKFVKNIGHQIDSVWFGVNMGAYPESRDIKSAHNAARVKGVVPYRQFRKQKGKPWLDLIPVGQKNDYKKIQQAKAFRAKAAWVKAYNDLGKPKMSGVDSRINRHAEAAHGFATKTGHDIKAKVEITNATSYIKNIQSQAEVSKSHQQGFKNGLKWMQITTAKSIEKANK